jgi:hypothetical protein
MNYTYRNLLITSGLALSLTAGISEAQAQDNGHTLRLENHSSYDIYEVHLSSTSDPKWGPDLLRRQVLGTGQMFSIVDIDADEYDMKLVDEDGDECIRRISIFTNRTWDISTERLLGCELHQLSH